MTETTKKALKSNKAARIVASWKLAYKKKYIEDRKNELKNSLSVLNTTISFEFVISISKAKRSLTKDNSNDSNTFNASIAPNTSDDPNYVGDTRNSNASDFNDSNTSKTPNTSEDPKYANDASKSNAPNDFNDFNTFNAPDASNAPNTSDGPNYVNEASNYNESYASNASDGSEYANEASNSSDSNKWRY
ncbi:hypothetical protein G7Y89_g4932 [Cudoniella acicularis]|uniref:Uncharacterized protein n=1 Tax=Cudoniella acicularis TaxID=354080 RepID=A0A8H4W486_9HELO|nr:hypothetical protein G7Y89_g4932 [Cudoniella acicularis]